MDVRRVDRTGSALGGVMMLRAKGILRSLKNPVPRDGDENVAGEPLWRRRANLWCPACNLEEDRLCVDCGEDEEGYTRGRDV